MPEVIQTRPATPEYREGWERIFGKDTHQREHALTPLRKLPERPAPPRGRLRDDEFSEGRP